MGLYLFRHPGTESLITGTGVVADGAEEKKKRKNLCLSATYYFVPSAIETRGALGAEASDFLHRLGLRITIVTGEQRATEFLL